MTQGFNPTTRDPRFFETPYSSTWDKVIAFAARTLAVTPPVVPVLDLHPDYQPNVDFKKLKADGFGAVIVKLTEANWVVDGSHEYCYRAQDADLAVMVYHFFRSNVSGQLQANTHLFELYKIVERLLYKPPTWADVETPDNVSVNTRVGNLLNYLEVTNDYRARSGFYSSPYLWQQLIGNTSWAPNYDGWVAHWTSASSPTLPIGWVSPMLKLWQIGVSGKHSWVPLVPAVTTNVDYNYFFGTQNELRAYCGVVEPIPPDDDLQEQIDALNKRVTDLENAEYKVVRI